MTAFYAGFINKDKTKKTHHGEWVLYIYTVDIVSFGLLRPLTDLLQLRVVLLFVLLVQFLQLQVVIQNTQLMVDPPVY